MGDRNILRLLNSAMKTGDNLVLPVKAITADATLEPKDYNKLLTNRGAVGAVVLTLPDPVSANSGMVVMFACIATQNIEIKSTTAGKCIAGGDPAANGGKLSSSHEGETLVAISDGTSWLISATAAVVKSA